ncbi:hypothetical protein BJX62DRAFT_243849 [Aspergillus germanicus]
MCAFHSARIISRLGQFPLGNRPQAELVARLAACAEALEEQGSVFPTTAILRKGVFDLVNDAQLQRNGLHAASSIWEEEEHEENQRGCGSEGRHGSAGGAGGGQSGRGEIYSKYSITDVIRNLQFETGGNEEDQAGGHRTPIEIHDADSANTTRARPPVQQPQLAQPQHHQQEDAIMPGGFEPDTRNLTGYAGDIAA